jgi:alpha-tubulin suppressor-like RCC1 family protein
LLSVPHPPRWACERNGPQAVGRWAAVCVSDNHAAGLTCEGHIYTWGANNRGQLGHGDKCPGVIDAPVQVSALADTEVK